MEIKYFLKPVHNFCFECLIEINQKYLDIQFTELPTVLFFKSLDNDKHEIVSDGFYFLNIIDEKQFKEKKKEYYFVTEGYRFGTYMVKDGCLCYIKEFWKIPSIPLLEKIKIEVNELWEIRRRPYNSLVI